MRVLRAIRILIATVVMAGVAGALGLGLISVVGELFYAADYYDAEGGVLGLNRLPEHAGEATVDRLLPAFLQGALTGLKFGLVAGVVWGVVKLVVLDKPRR